MKKENTQEEKPSPLNMPFSRRALFAGLGLSALNLTLPSPAVASPGVGGGWYAWGGGSNGGVFYKDKGVGFCNGWQADWQCSRTTGNLIQRLRLALGMELTCDYSNELYTHVKAKPLMACGDDNMFNTSRLWYVGGEDNHGTLYLNNRPLSTFSGDLVNTELGAGKGYGWNTGFKGYAYTDPAHWQRRAREQVAEAYTAKVDISNVMNHGNWVKPPAVFTTLWLGVNLVQKHDKIFIRNRTDLYGLIVEIQDEQQRSQLAEVNRGTSVQGSSICIRGRNDRANQNWMVKPGRMEELDGLTHVFSPMNAKGLALCLNETGAAGPSMAANNTVQLHPYDATRASEWWAHDYGHGITYLFADASGRLLNRKNGQHSNGTVVNTYSTGYCDQWSNLANRWHIEEVTFKGAIELSARALDGSGSITCPNPRLTCTPRTYHENVDEGLEYIYRWYVHPTDSMNAKATGRVMGQSHIGTYGDQAEAPAHGHVGYPSLGKQAAMQGSCEACLESIRLYLDGWGVNGGIAYETDQGDTGADGSWCGPKGVSHKFGGVKVWLTGEATRHADLAYRVFSTGYGWSDTVYSSGADDAPLAGGALNSGNAVRGLWVMPVAKPLDAVAVSGYTTSPMFEMPEGGFGDIGVSPSYLSCAVMLSITRVSREDDTVFTDRYFGTVVSDAVKLISKVHFMLNDEKGDAVELFTKEMTTGSKLSTSDEAFGSAMEELGKLYEREVCELADRWYEGDEHGATDWGKKFESKKVNGETWIWMQIGWYRVRCYSDGTDSDKIVFEEKYIPVGRKFTIPQEAYDAAKKADCNLDAHFGTQSASGFTGWFRDKALTEPAPATLTTDKPGVIPLYARNRATLRAAYANGSALPEDGADYRTAPSDDAPAYPRAMRLPSFDEEPAHRLDGVELPATGDWADQHCLGYRGEVLTLPGYATVYQRLGDGRWRTFRAQGWTDDPDGAAGAGGAVRKSRSLTALRLAASPSSARVQVEADATRYIRWVESTVDGVETSE